MSTNSRKRKRNRLGKCDICQATDAIYTCPRCDTVSCSLNCVKMHKKELDCDGIRVHTKYVPLNKMNENNLLSDYRLLEEVQRHVETVEWLRKSLETPEKATADSTVDTVEKTAVVVEKIQTCDNESRENVEGSNTNVINGKKRKKRNSKLPLQVPKTEILIAKSGKVRREILNRQESRKKRIVNLGLNHKNIRKNDNSKCKSQGTYSTSSEASSLGLPEGSSEDNIDSKSYVASTSATIVTVTQNVPIPQSLELSEQNTSSNHTLTATTGGKRKLSSKEEVTDTMTKKILKTKTAKVMDMERLYKVAYKRGIFLCPLPANFEKRWENSSFFVPDEDCIYWHLKVSFINANFYTLSLKKCAETMKLSEVVNRCLQRSKKYLEENDLEDPLTVYRKMDFSKISVLMAADNVSSNDKKFYILDMTKSLRENFIGKCIVEFPQLCLGLDDCYVVTNVHNNLRRNYFEGSDSGSGKDDEPLNEFEKAFKKTMIKKRKKLTQRDDSDKESGELTDSSDNDNEFSDTFSDDDSEEELFKESEFRSIYKDLLSTFDNDLHQIH